MQHRSRATSSPGGAVLYMNHTSVVGGAEQALLEHLRIMPATCGSGPVLCPPGELADALAGRGISVIPFRGTAVSFRFTARSLGRGAWDFLSSARAIRRAARDAGCDVVHANSIRAGLMACFARLIGGPPVIVHVHDVLPPGPVSRLVRSLLLRRSAALVAVSRFTRTAFVDGLRPSSTPFPVLHNPLDIEDLTSHAPGGVEARETLHLPAGAPVLGVIGQITPWKAQHTAISALAEVLKVLPDTQLLIVGEARFVDPSTRYDNRAYRAELDAMVTDLGVSHAVHFLGQRDDIPLIMRALDLLLLPSAAEPLARVACEAMALGTPVLATDVGGLPEVIDDGSTGFLLAPGDASEWAARILELLQEPARMATISERAHAAIVERLDGAHYVEQMTSLYEQVEVRSHHLGRRSAANGAEPARGIAPPLNGDDVDLLASSASRPSAVARAGQSSKPNRQ